MARSKKLTGIQEDFRAPWYTALDHRALGLILSRREMGRKGGGRKAKREREEGKEGRRKGERGERDEGARPCGPLPIACLPRERHHT